MGFEFDVLGFGMGICLQCWVVVIKDGVVQMFNVEFGCDVGVSGVLVMFEVFGF